MKRDHGLDQKWIDQRARVLMPLVDRLNHVGEYVRGLEEHANDEDVAQVLSSVEDTLARAMTRVARREELPFTESTFRNYIRRYPAFEHQRSAAPPAEAPQGAPEEVAHRTTKLMNWLQIE